MRIFKRYRNNEQGNIAMMFAILFMTLLMGIGCAFDMTQITAQKARLNDLADATALAAAIATREDKAHRLALAHGHFENNRELSGNIIVEDDPIILFDDAAQDVTVEVSAVYQYTLMSIFGFENPTVTATAKVGYMVDEIAPLSVAFAFDTSGSMGWLTSDGHVKMTVLQQATNDLFEELYEASENPELLDEEMTTSFSSYNRELVDSEDMDEGSEHIIDAVDEMEAVGGTNSTPSLQHALDQLDDAAADESDSSWAGYLVFMTDGDNNDVDADGNPVTWDADSYAKCDEIKAAGYKIYTVAFEAPAKGEALLEHCATDPTSYFDSSNATELKNAFKLIGQQLGSSTIRIKS